MFGSCKGGTTGPSADKADLQDGRDKDKQHGNRKSHHPDRSSSMQFDKPIADQYKVGDKIGSGSYGQIRLGTDMLTGETVAIKFESPTPDQQLAGEYAIYKQLAGKKGFPTVYYFGHYADFDVLVMERLGRNLETLFDDCKRRFTLKSLLFLVLQLLKRFETIHHERIVYRDVKPENFMLGVQTNTVYLIDFGLSKEMPNKGKSKTPTNDRSSSDGKESSGSGGRGGETTGGAAAAAAAARCHTTNELIGTSRYMSINAHLCREQSRRDDLEALGYVFVYFLRGKLPWSGLKATSFREHNQMIVDRKRHIAAEELCDGFSPEFLYYLKYVRSLEFDAEPNYEKLRNMFKRRFHLEHFRDDGIYDWNKTGAAANDR